MPLPARTTTTKPVPTGARGQGSPPHAPAVASVVSQSWPGNLEYPDDVAATFALRTSGGVVSATAAWSGTPALSISVRCDGAGRTATGTTGLYVAAVAGPGTCAVTIAEPAGTEAVVSYSLVTHYPAVRR